MNNNPKAWFVTGTDTDVGKTLISTALVDWLAQQGSACGYKPVAAGCSRIDGQLRNDDALALQAASQPTPDYPEVNPVALQEAIAPHIAADWVDKRIHLDNLAETAHQLCNKYEYVVAEGAGGWLVPLNEQQTFADLAKALDFPVILVVAIKLGCINHALLTANAIENSGLTLAGWVANAINPEMDALEENISSLKQRINAPLLGTLPKLAKPDTTTIQQHIGFQSLVS